MSENLNECLDEFAIFLSKLIVDSCEIASLKSYGDNGAVIALNGLWGSGKTTFLNIFKTKSSAGLFKSTPIIINYNAWENDYFDDPLISLIGQIDQQCNFNADSSITSKFKEKGIALLKSISEACAVINPAMAIANQAIRIVSNAYDNVIKGDFEDSINAYQSITSLKTDFIHALLELEPDKIKIILIDELDRCNPLFAIKLLERIKHFFNLKNVVFIIAVDMNALSSSMKAIYGSEYITEQYLSRFFDYELQLPHHENFYRNLIYKQFNGQESEQNFIISLANFFGIQPREQVKLCRYFLILTKEIEKQRDTLYLLLSIKFINNKKYNEIINQHIEINETNLEEKIHKFIKDIEGIGLKRPGLFQNYDDIYHSIIFLFCIICSKSSEKNLECLEKIQEITFSDPKIGDFLIKNLNSININYSQGTLNIFVHYLAFFKINTTTKTFRHFQMITAN